MGRQTAVYHTRDTEKRFYSTLYSGHINPPDMANVIKDKVELHVHLDGSVRLETVLDLAKQRGIKLPADNVKDLEPYCRANPNMNLTEFLACFSVFTPPFIGDVGAIERISYEFCEDSAKAGILYSEVRYAPHLMTGDKLTTSDVIEAVNRGLAKGSAEFGIIMRSILCCMRHVPAWDMEVLELCQKYRDAGVVGIDLAGDEINFPNKDRMAVFKKAKEVGVHRTVHAGEAGPALHVKEAILEMGAERIGHGYHTVDDEAILKLALETNVHFEICPHSSIVTSAVKNDPPNHPLIKMNQAGLNWSISTDDTTLTGRPITEDYQLVMEGMNLTKADIAKANINGAKSCFLPEDEKKAPVEKITEANKANLA